MVTGLTGLVADDTDQNDQATSPPDVTNRAKVRLQVTGVANTPNGLTVCVVTKHTPT